MQILKAFVVANRGRKANFHFLPKVSKRSSLSLTHLSPDLHSSCGMVWYRTLRVIGYAWIFTKIFHLYILHIFLISERIMKSNGTLQLFEGEFSVTCAKVFFSSITVYVRGKKDGVCWLVGCLTSQQHASVPQGRICSDKFTCCHTEIVADQTNFLPHPVTVYWHQADQSHCWSHTRRLAG